MCYHIGPLSLRDENGLAAADRLLAAQGIRRDANLDYFAAAFDDDFNIAATGGCFGNTLRCLAVAGDHQGEGLLNRMVTHLINVQMERGNSHLFLYTKPESAKFFRDLGFYDIVQIAGQVAFMENRRHGFQHYLERLNADRAAFETRLETPSAVGFHGVLRRAALVMNCNPFTLGHQYLVERAAAENDVVHVFVVSEDQSLFPFAVRKALVQAGTAHLPNVMCHDSGSYLISQSTFPAYFQPNDNAVIESNALLDAHLFTQIAAAMGIERRYVGTEPFSRVTGIYNRILQRELPPAGVTCVEIERKTQAGSVISASTVRQALKDGDMHAVQTMVTPTTYEFLLSDAARPILARLRQADNVVHY